MRRIRAFNLVFVSLLASSILFLSACATDDSQEGPLNTTLTQVDKEALLFMLEEEKLARDTYTFLDDLWSINQFANIKTSEQTHMNAVENLLIQYNIDYTIYAIGEFVNQELQGFYDQFEIDGSVSPANALQIGATIEDLDIVDLQSYLDATSNTSLIDVFESLQCGSRNHLRSFASKINDTGGTYTPQFLSQDVYDGIIASNRENCN